MIAFPIYGGGAADALLVSRHISSHSSLGHTGFAQTLKRYSQLDAPVNTKPRIRGIYLFLLIPSIVLGICGIAVWLVGMLIFSVTVQLPDAAEFNPQAGVEFGELSTKSLVTIGGCHNRKIVTAAAGRQYAFGELIGIHIMPNTKIYDRRGRWFGVPTQVEMLQPGQTLAVQMEDIPTMIGEGITASTITILADGVPEPCSLHWLNTASTTP